ncbi:MAG: hypothetical protein AB7E95_02935 [Kiritimatiellales bacterium]
MDNEVLIDVISVEKLYVTGAAQTGVELKNSRYIHLAFMIFLFVIDPRYQSGCSQRQHGHQNKGQNPFHLCVLVSLRNRHDFIRKNPEIQPAVAELKKNVDEIMFFDDESTVAFMCKSFETLNFNPVAIETGCPFKLSQILSMCRKPPSTNRRANADKE